MGKDINEKKQLVPELRNSPHAAYPMNRDRWIRPTQEAKTPAADGKQATFVAQPAPPKGETNKVKQDYVWGPGSKGFGHYHLLTKEAYVALASRQSSTEENSDMEDLRDVYRIVVYPRSKSPVPKDTYARDHVVGEGRAGLTPPEDMRWKDIAKPIVDGKVKV